MSPRQSGVDVQINLYKYVKRAVEIQFSMLPTLVGPDAMWTDAEGNLQEAFAITVDDFHGLGDADLIYKQSYKGGRSGEYDFDQIGGSKCDVTIRTGQWSRYVPLEQRLDGETGFWGSVLLDHNFEGQQLCLVIGGSGYKSEIDEWICESTGTLVFRLIEADIRAAREAGDTTEIEFVIDPLAA